MFVVLRRSAEQEQATLELLIGQLHDPHSANYHNCLTADELRTRFGPAQEDINTVVRRLSSHGFTVHLVHQMGMTVEVSATAAQVQDAGTIPGDNKHRKLVRQHLHQFRRLYCRSEFSQSEDSTAHHESQLSSL
jgi:pro-kumamolisin-like protein